MQGLSILRQKNKVITALCNITALNKANSGHAKGLRLSINRAEFISNIFLQLKFFNLTEKTKKSVLEASMQKRVLINHAHQHVCG